MNGKQIVLDPDFSCYAITSIINPNHFTFDYYEEPSQKLGDEVTVHCYEYGEIRGEFRATRLFDISWEATR